MLQTESLQKSVLAIFAKTWCIIKRFYLSLNVLVFMIVLSNPVIGQTIRILDSNTNKLVENAHVCWQSLHSKSKGFCVADKSGITVLKEGVTFPIVIRISCVGFKTKTDTVYQAAEHTCFLERYDEKINEVIVTGELTPVVMDSSVYRVKTILADEIKMSGSTSLTDILLSKANIRISMDQSLGSQIEMMGMEGQNVKIMIDGVPVLGRLDGNIDLSQVNISNVDHIEIVEGPMSVVYGNNALAGTINIITKEGSRSKADLKVGTQLEGIGKYSGDIAFSEPVGQNVFAFNAFSSYFKGVDFDSSTRSMDWRPTKNYQVGLNYNRIHKNWKYGVDLNGYYGSLLIKSDISSNYMVYDTYYYTKRFNTSFRASGLWGNHNSLSVLANYSFYNRASQEYDKDLTTLKGVWQDKEISQDFQETELRATYGHAFMDLNLDFQTGIDFNVETMGGPRVDESEYEDLGDYAFFMTFKYKPVDKIHIQPGLRYAYNTEFTSPPVYSLHVKYFIHPKLSWGISLAKGFRAPSLKEMYYYFVNSSHDIHGNPDLEAEYSHHIHTYLDFSPRTDLKLSLSGFYNDLHNKIELIENTSVSDGYYSYQNINRYKSLGGDLEISCKVNKCVKFNCGLDVTGRYNEYSEEGDYDDFTYSTDIFGGLRILESFTKIHAFLDYKYNGVKPYYTLNEEDEIQRGEQSAYNLVNASLSRSVFSHHLELSFGVRNLLDVTSVKLSVETSDGHGSSDANDITYGRSWFFNASYSF